MSLRRSVYSGARAFFSEIAQGTSAKTVRAIRQARSDAVQVAEKCSRRGGDTHSSVYQFQSCRQYCRRSGPEFQNRSPVWLISAPCPTTYLLSPLSLYTLFLSPRWCAIQPTSRCLDKAQVRTPCHPQYNAAHHRDDLFPLPRDCIHYP